jgi:outer membrane protein
VTRLNKSKLWGLAVVAALFAVPAFAQTKIAVVDYRRLFEESPQMKVLRDSVQAEFGPRDKEIQNLTNTLRAKRDKLVKDSATMSPDQRERAEKELRDGARDLENKSAELKEDINARNSKEMSRLNEALVEEVRAYAKAQGFDLVIADGVIYSTPTLDITPAVLSSLQARGPRAPAGGGAAAPKPPATTPAPPAR